MTCDAGFDATQAPMTECQKTEKGFYSSADDKSRTDCKGKPVSSHARWIVHSTLRSGTRGAQNNGECAWECARGYERNSDGDGDDCVEITGAPVVDNSCTSPSSEDPNPPSIANGSQKRTCSNDNEWGNWVVTCHSGFVKDESDPNDVHCRVPDGGYYANASNAKVKCSSIGDNFKGWKANPSGGRSDDTCDFDCHTSYVKDGTNRSCRPPVANYFVAANGAETSCGNPPPNGSWIPVQPDSVTSADTCQFVCNPGYVPDGQQGANRACYKSPDTRSISVSVNQGGESTSTVIGEERRIYTKGRGYNSWTVASCVSDYHIENNTCLSNEKPCTLDDGQGVSLPGKLLWDSTLNEGEGGWPSSASGCQVLGCPSVGAKEPRDIAHGTQERLCGNDNQWGDWGLKGCDAGYDRRGSNQNNECTLTKGGYYSIANQKGRTACSVDKPENAHWTTTGLSTDSCLWACNEPHYVFDVPSGGGTGRCQLATGRRACALLDMTDQLAGLPPRCKREMASQNSFFSGVTKYRFNFLNGVCKGYRDASRTSEGEDALNLFHTVEDCERICPVVREDGNGNSYVLAEGVQVSNGSYYGKCIITSCLGDGSLPLVNPITNECVASCPAGQSPNEEGTACVLTPFRLDALPLIRASNASAFPFSGDCSLESEVEVILHEGVSAREVTKKTLCAEGKWSLSFDLSSFPVRRIPYKIKYKDRNQRVQRWMGSLKSETLLAQRQEVVWEPSYTPATLRWKMAAYDLTCDGRIDLSKRHGKV